MAAAPLPPSADNIAENGRRILREIYPRLREELIDYIRNMDLSKSFGSELTDYYTKCLDYNCQGGKMTRGVIVLEAAKAVKGVDSLDKKTEELAAVLGWCVEFLQAFFLVADDIMDSSHTRRGLPCWYKLPEVGVANAVNDVLFIHSCLFRMLERYFADKDYQHMLHLVFHETTQKTIIGQHLDTNTQSPLTGDKGIQLERFTSWRHHAIVVNKTAHYSFYLPCVLGMTLVGIRDESLFQQVRDICLQIGEYFQVQDDYLDCFASAEVLGKVGTDIEEKKCSWLVLQVLSRVTPEEREKLKECYGTSDPQNVEWVKTLYRKYELQRVYYDFEENAKAKLDGMIEGVKNRGVNTVLRFMLDRIYKRQK